MSSKVYELRFFQGDAEVKHASRIQVVLDRADLEEWPGLLTRHLFGVAERHGYHRDQAHLFHLEVREIDRYNSMTQDVLFRWALPVLPADER